MIKTKTLLLIIGVIIIGSALVLGVNNAYGGGVPTELQELQKIVAAITANNAPPPVPTIVNATPAGMKEIILKSTPQLHCMSDRECPNPHTVTISVGDSVAWKNENTYWSQDIISGISSSPTNDFASGWLEPGHVFTYQFNEPGTFHFFNNAAYYTDIMNMGVVIVTP